MVQRVDFLQKGAYTLTYRNMLLLLGAFALFCALIHGFFSLRYFFANRKLSVLERAKQELSVKQQEAMAFMQAEQNQQVSESVMQSLTQVFSTMPVWSGALSDLANAMPKLVWLQTIKSSDMQGRSDVRMIEVTGKGTSAGGVVQFVKAIEDSAVFRNAAIISSQKGPDGFSFVINCEVQFPEVRW